LTIFDHFGHFGQKPQKSLNAKNPKNHQKFPPGKKPTKIPDQKKIAITKILKQLKSPNKMEHYEKLYDWINQNYSALQISYLNYQNQEKVNFTLYCIAMYVKHQSLFS
jgi:hypothetical protein